MGSTLFLPPPVKLLPVVPTETLLFNELLRRKGFDCVPFAGLSPSSRVYATGEADRNFRGESAVDDASVSDRVTGVGGGKSEVAVSGDGVTEADVTSVAVDADRIESAPEADRSLALISFFTTS